MNKVDFIFRVPIATAETTVEVTDMCERKSVPNSVIVQHKNCHVDLENITHLPYTEQVIFKSLSQ